MSSIASKFEGEYFGFVFQTDYMNDQAIKVDRLKNGKLVEFWNPLDHADIENIGYRVDEKGCEFLVKNGVLTIWTPGEENQLDLLRPAVNSLLGQNLSWDYMLDGNRQWGVYRGLDSYYRNMLRDFRIKVEYLREI